MRILGLDVGEKTIGVAVSDLMGWTAQGVTVVRRRSLEEDFAALRELVAEYQVESFVVGLPAAPTVAMVRKQKKYTNLLSNWKGNLPSR